MLIIIPNGVHALTHLNSVFLVAENDLHCALVLHQRDVFPPLWQLVVLLQAGKMSGGKQNWSVGDTTFLLEIFKDRNKMWWARRGSRGRADKAAFVSNTGGSRATFFFSSFSRKLDNFFNARMICSDYTLRIKLLELTIPVDLELRINQGLDWTRKTCTCKNSQVALNWR